jgi:hypothetical protein
MEPSWEGRRATACGAMQPQAGGLESGKLSERARKSDIACLPPLALLSAP